MQWARDLAALHHLALHLRDVLVLTLFARQEFHPHIAIGIYVFVSLFELLKENQLKPTADWRPLPTGDKQTPTPDPHLGSAKATGGELHDEWLLCPWLV